MNKKVSTALILITVFIDLMGFGIIIPILPSFATKELSMSEFDIGIVIAAFSLIQFIVSPILGRLSDKIGRRPVILFSLFLTATSYVLLSFADSFLILLLSRMLAGLGGGNIGVAQAYISDITSKENRTKGMGLIGAAFGMGFVLGPMIGGLLSKYGYMVVGLSSAGFSFVAFVFAFFFLPESNPHTDKTTKIKIKIIDVTSLKEVVKKPALSSLIFLFFIITFSMANMHGTFALLGLKHYSFSDEQIAYLYAIMGFAIVLVQGGLVRVVTDKFKNKTLISFGLTFMMLGLGMLPYGGSYLNVIIITMIMSLGSGILQPVALSMISKYADEKEHGMVMGLNQSIGSLGRVLGPIWGGFSFKYLGYKFPFLTAAFFTLIILIITIVLFLKNTFNE